MKASKIVVLTKVEKSSTFAFAWDGDLFFKNSKTGGIVDTLNLTKLLKFKFCSQTMNLAGDFCLMPYLVK